jgi:Phage gp6-like head-tail connector protein
MLRLVSGPAAEPVSLQDAKLHLRVEVTDDDALISRLIKAARQQAETRLNRALVNQTWELVLDSWPLASPLNWGRPFGVIQSLNMPAIPASEIRITNPDLASVTSISYLDPAGTTQVLDPATYVVLAGTPGRIFPATGRTWPAVRTLPGAITVRYVAGWGPDATTVPECVQTWILMHVGAWYESREALSAGGLTPLPGLDGLLAPADWGAYA